MKKSNVVLYAILAVFVADVLAISLIVGHYRGKCRLLQSEIEDLKNNQPRKKTVNKSKQTENTVESDESSKVRKDGDDSRKLLGKLRDMKKKLEDNEKKIAEIKSAADNKTPQDQPQNNHQNNMSPTVIPPFSANNYGDYLKQLKETDPENFDAVIQGTKKFAAFSSQVLDERRNFYENLDVSILDQDQLDFHQKFLDMNKHILEMSDMASKTDDPDEIGRLMNERNQLMPEYFGLLNGEKKTALLSFAKSIGYNKEEGAQLLEYINYLETMSRPRYYQPEDK